MVTQVPLCTALVYVHRIQGNFSLLGLLLNPFFNYFNSTFLQLVNHNSVLTSQVRRTFRNLDFGGKHDRIFIWDLNEIRKSSYMCSNKQVRTWITDMGFSAKSHKSAKVSLSPQRDYELLEEDHSLSTLLGFRLCIEKTTIHM